MRRFVAIAGVVALGGCAQGIWLKPGATQAEFAQNQARCQLYAEDATPEHYTPHSNKLGSILAAGLVDGIATGLQQRHKSDLCMAADGWQFVPQVQTAAQAPPAPPAPLPFEPGHVPGHVPGEVAAGVIPVRAAAYPTPYRPSVSTVLAAAPLVREPSASIALPPFPDEPGW